VAKSQKRSNREKKKPKQDKKRDKKTLTPAPSPLTFDRREKPGGSGGRKKT
jgi:hypothetical protein